MRLILLICSSLLLFQPAWSQKTDHRLEKKVQALLQDFHGETGVFIQNLRTGRIVAIRADSLFPTASMIKVSILVGLMDKIRKDELQYHQVMQYNDSLLYPGVDLLGSFKSGEKVELSKLMMLMLTMSDNTASLWLQSLAGGGTRINELLDSLGFVHTRVNSKTPGREAQRELYGWGQTSPREMVELFEKIYYGEIFGPEWSGRMLRLLGRNYWDEEALSQVPPGIFVASKSGAVDASRSETLLVMAPHGPYAFSLITNHQTDQSWEPQNEGWELARRLSALLWHYYEPNYRKPTR